MRVTNYTALLLVLVGCSTGADASGRTSGNDSTVAVAAADSQAAGSQAVGDPSRAPNELGKIMVLEYHLIGDKNALYERERGAFRQDLQTLYDRGYRPVSMSDVFDKKINLPAGLSPVVFTFDDASPSQFKYIETNGQLEIDPNSGLGIWLDFAKKHSDWPNKAVWCMLSGAAAGRAFFGDKGIEGQKTEWRHRKVKFLADQGFELCNHTLWHAQLSKYPDAVVQEQIARLQMAIDSAVPGYRVRTMALPQGLWPKNRELAWRGSWTDPKSKKTISYNYDVVLEVAGGPMKSPYDPAYNGHSTPRVQVIGTDVIKAMDALEKNGTRYVSDGKPGVAGAPPK